jgi:transitional endoplasmic reticulum ATPase
MRQYFETMLGTTAGAQTTKHKSDPGPEFLYSRAGNLTGLAKVAGMHELKALLKREVVRAFRNPEVFRRYGLTVPQGILLYGPPGCGKTYIARLLAEELGCSFIEASQSDVGSSYIHGTALRIRTLFETAEKSAPCVLFVDEFEGTVPSRANLGSHQQFKSEEVNEFLVQLNGCSQKKILVIAATNEPQKIDAAVLRTGRMDKLIYVGPPDAEARFEMLHLHLSNRPTDSSMDIRGLALILEGYSASDIKFIVDEAARNALERATQISTEILMQALKRVPPSITEDIAERYRSFGSRGI